MSPKDFFNTNCITIILFVLVVKSSNAQCTTNGCTVCSETELVCQGLDRVPPLDPLPEDPSAVEQRISLTNGAISEIPAGYFNISNVESIDLSNNQLTTLNMDSFEYVSSLRTIDLTGNSIDCNSNIDWLQKWKSFHPANTVTGSCTGGGTIEEYLSDKPGNLVSLNIAGSSFAFDRTACSEVTVPFIVTGDFSSPLEYRAFTEQQSSKADIRVVNEYITVPVGTNFSEVIIEISNRGENREDISAFLQIFTKYPVSYETNAQIHFENGAVGCMAPVPVITETTQTPPVSTDAQGSVTPKPGDDTTSPKASTEPTSEPEPTTPEEKGFPDDTTSPKVTPEPTLTPEPPPSGKKGSADDTTSPKVTPEPTLIPEPPPSRKKGSAAWVIIPIIIVVFVIGGAVFAYKKYKTPNKTDGGEKPVGYTPVKGGDGKVYSDTTQDIA